MDGFNNVCMIFFIIYIGQVVHISNEILDSVCQKYISLRNYDRNGVNTTWNVVSDVLMWIKTKNRSLQWIQYHGCQVLNETAEKEANNTRLKLDNTSYSIQKCVNSCNSFDKTLVYFGLKDGSCHCFKNRLQTSNVTHKCLGETRCDGNNTLMLYSKTDDYSDNTTDRGSKCAAIQLTPDGTLTVVDTHCNTELPYICLRCNKTTDNRKKCVNSAMDCMEDIHNLKKTTSKLQEDAYWIVIPRNEHFLSKERDAESTCIVTTFYNNIVSPVIKDCCNMSYYMMCNDTDWTKKSQLLSSSYFCFTTECIVYISSSVAGIICITVFIVLVCNAYRNKKKVRIKKIANRTVEEIQLDDMPTASSYLYEEHFDADINQINQTEPNEVNHGENEISGSKSKLKEDPIRPNKNTEEQAIAENEYNSLNHTLRQPDIAASNAVYDKVKPAIITLIRGEQFVGTEYDSVDVLKRNTNTHLAKL